MSSLSDKSVKEISTVLVHLEGLRNLTPVDARLVALSIQFLKEAMKLTANKNASRDDLIRAGTFVEVVMKILPTHVLMLWV